MRKIHLVEIYCEDTRPGHQLKASKKQLVFSCWTWDSL